MLILIKHFIHCLFHPFRGLGPLSPGQLNQISSSKWHFTYARIFHLRPLSIGEYLAISWPIVMIGAFYNLTEYPMTKLFTERLGLEFSESDFFISPIYSTIYQLTLIAFYPLIGFLYVKVWTVIISLFMDLLNQEYDIKDVELVASNTLVAKSFLLIPLIGPFLAKLMAPFYLYAGLKGRLGLSNGQAIVVVISPLILVLLLLAVFLFLLIVFFSAF